jgi:hypothetical protein
MKTLIRHYGSSKIWRLHSIIKKIVRHTQRAFSIQDSPFHSERTFVHEEQQDPWRSTNEHNAHWNKNVEYQTLKKIVTYWTIAKLHTDWKDTPSLLYQRALSKTPIQELKWYLCEQKEHMIYATGHNAFTSKCLLNIHIYCSFWTLWNNIIISNSITYDGLRLQKLCSEVNFLKHSN